MIVFIGGGITGLAAAYELGRRGYPVTVYEKTLEPGGLAAPFTVAEGVRLEKFYHHFFRGQHHLMTLLEDLGIADRLVWEPTRMGFFCDGQVYPFSGPKDILGFRPLPFHDRIRFGIGGLLLSKSRIGAQGDDTPAIDWLRRRCGARATRTIWEPLLKMKFGTAFDQVSITWLQNRIQDRQKGRKGSGKEALGYLRGSIGLILDRLVEEIRKQGNRLVFGASVEGLEVSGDRVTGVRVEGRVVGADAVVATVPNPIFARVAACLPQRDLEPLLRIRYQGTVCMIVKARKPFTRFYWINVIDRDIPFVAAIEHTNFLTAEEYGGHLIYLGKYLERDAREWSMTDAELTAEFVRGLRKMSPGLSDDDIDQVWVFKDPLTQPVFDGSYSKPSMRTSLPNLFLANTSMLFPDSRTINSSIGLAHEVLEQVQPVVAETLARPAGRTLGEAVGGAA